MEAGGEAFNAGTSISIKGPESRGYFKWPIEMSPVSAKGTVWERVDVFGRLKCGR